MIPAVKDSVVPKARPALTYGKIEIATPVVLAPMAGITNTAFRRLCREFGGGLYVSEMVTSRALVERTEESMRLIGHHSSEEVRSVQLYGVDPKTISEAITMLIAEDRADHIDLNFGCPVPKVTRKGWRRSFTLETRPLLIYFERRRKSGRGYPAHNKNAQRY
jgi:tRNA-dihydrouridine synthase